jgi:Tol biopolymer transport system component
MCGLGLAVAWLPVVPAAAGSQPPLARVSIGAGGAEAQGASTNPSISASGRYVAFASTANNLVTADGNNKSDVFVRDLVLNTTTRVSVDVGGGDANGPSQQPSISGDGRYVAFESSATDLVSNNPTPQDQINIFVRDRVMGTTTQASVTTTGGEPVGDSTQPSLSDDGHFVAFTSIALGLVAEDGTGPDVSSDVFVRDLTTRSTERVSVDAAGGDPDRSSTNPSISAEGRYVVFDSYAFDLVNDGETENQDSEIYRRDVVADVTLRVTAGLPGRTDFNSSYGSPDVSADGQAVVFYSGFNHQHVDFRNLRNGVVVRISAQPSQYSTRDSYGPRISSDGRRVVYHSNTPNGDLSDTNGLDDVFQVDIGSGTLARLSAGAGADGYSYDQDVNADGTAIAFASFSPLVPADQNRTFDVYLSRPGPPKTSYTYATCPDMSPTSHASFDPPLPRSSPATITWTFDPATAVTNCTGSATVVAADLSGSAITPNPESCASLAEHQAKSVFVLGTFTANWDTGTSSSGELKVKFGDGPFMNRVIMVLTITAGEFLSPTAEPTKIKSTEVSLSGDGLPDCTTTGEDGANLQAVVPFVVRHR